VGVMEVVVKSEPDKTTPKTTVVVEEVHNAAVVQGIKSVVDSERTRNESKKIVL
jgi:phenylpyruvate tautomerase PptA (4-oxalocrotonate tautomerase family)